MRREHCAGAVSFRATDWYDCGVEGIAWDGSRGLP